MSHHDANHGTDEREYWNERYSASVQLWSGAPNSIVVEVASTLAPGSALDVGCGEGADAVWLALQAWDVTALDVSDVALSRAEVHARDAGVSVHWLLAGLLDAQLAPASFDLVSAQYPVLSKTPDAVAEHVLLDAVAVGGTLVFVHHADFQSNDHAHGDFNPADYVGPWDVLPLLGADWQVETNETRPRSVATGAGAGHSEDVILVARRVT